MEYYEVLNLKREPFSNSPDPDMFYRSRSQLECLHQLEIAIRLRRGLNVVLGGVGSGKTTICRQLVRELARDGSIDACLILDPGFADQFEFLAHLGRSLGIPDRRIAATALDLKEQIKFHLFERAVEKNRVVCLIIDEGQKITPECMESLRELLNYETNEYKLLQIIIFAQNEFMDFLKAQANLADRVNHLHNLMPLSFRETREMIETRLSLAAKGGHARPTFTAAAMAAVYLYSGGFPRKIIRLCHKALLSIVDLNDPSIGVRSIIAAARSEVRPDRPAVAAWRRAAMIGGSTLALGWLLYILAIGPAALVRCPEPGQDMAATESGQKSTAASQAVAEPARDKTAAAPAPGTETAQIPDQKIDSPVSLGQAVLWPGWSVKRRLEDLYGRKDKDVYEAMLKANPTLDDLTESRQGASLNYPPVPTAPPPPGSILVSLATPANLTKGFQFVVDRSTSSHPLKLFATFSPTEGVRYEVVLAKLFGSPEEAGKALSKLPKDLSKQARVITYFAPGTVFYTAMVPTDKPDAVEMAKSEKAKATEAELAKAKPADQPAILGKAVLKPGWAFWRRLEDLYGRKNKAVYDALAKTNPGIESINDVRPGTQVTYPALAVSAPPPGSALIAVARADSLAKGFEQVVSTTSPDTPLRLFVTSVPGEGLRFDVVLAKLYPNLDAAKTALSELPPELAKEAKVIGAFPAGTIYYTALAPTQTSALAQASEPAAPAQPQTAQVKPQPQGPAKLEAVQAAQNQGPPAVSLPTLPKAATQPAHITPEVPTPPASAQAAPVPPAAPDKRFDPPSPPADPAAKKEARPQSQAPDVKGLLGQAELRTGWALWRRMDDLYGRRSKEVFEALIKANPTVESVVDVRQGTMINYPSVPTAAPPSGSALVAVARTDNLSAAFDFVIARSTPVWPLRIFATQTGNEPPRFDVIVAKLYEDIDSAMKIKTQLPPDLGGGAAVLSAFAPGTVFYTTVSSSFPSKSVAQVHAAPAGASGAVPQAQPVQDLTTQKSAKSRSKTGVQEKNLDRTPRPYGPPEADSGSR